jgi:hypothetical protein
MEHFWEKANLPSMWEYMKSLVYPKRDPRRLEQTRRYSTKSPTGIEFIKAKPDHAAQLAHFLQKNYKTGTTKSPICTITSESIIKQLSDGAIYLIVYDKDKQIAGCIGASRLGTIQPGNIPLRLIREFCIAPLWRKTGLGSYLLLSIWNTLKVTSEDSVLFLKEGAPLSSAGPTLHTGIWGYKYFKHALQPPIISCKEISATQDQEEYIKTFAEYSNISLYNSITPAKSDSKDTIVLYYKGFKGEILAAFTNAYQRIDKYDIWYMTGWFTKGGLLDIEYLDAAQTFGNYIVSRTGSDIAIWLDYNVLPKNDEWLKDGPFHWYAFQWTAGIYNEANLFLRV